MIDSEIPVRQPSLANQVLDILIDRILSGVYPPGSKLPPETQFTKEFNVSRVTIRNAFSKLEDRKLIQRRQGVGTYVSKLLNISNPLNRFIEFPKLIAENRYQPGFEQVSAEIVEPEINILENLQVETGSKVLEIRKIFTADGDAIIYVVNHIPLWVFEDFLSPEEAIQPGITEHFIAFFEDQCNQRVSHFVSTVRPDIYKNIDAPEVLINEGPYTPVLIINEIGYNHEERPIVSSCEYHPDNWMTFTIIRRRGGY
jgi:GntR family transcriptional regulator